ncbi:MAG TPA: hypothetical protein VLC46_19515 [Thermoanaerobaculia bacterium]|jgi:hypothetical protein|nr:hypothetical protein [Thermoanaerobaculia bacterium]
MSEEVTVVTPPLAPDSPAPTANPTVTHYEQVAARVSAALDEMLALIPNFAEYHPATREFVRTHQGVPIEFVATAIAAVEANPELQGIRGFDVMQARNALQFIDAFRPVADKLNASAKNVEFTIDVQRAEVNNGALQLYGIAKVVARSPLSTTVATHVGYLKRDLGRTGVGRKKKGTPAPVPGTHATEGGGMNV